ncbi:hypothetical protein PGB90_008868 [Kerria lacca]
MLRIKWTEKVKNEDVLRRIRGDRVIWKMPVKRRARMIGHNLRHPGMPATVVEGVVEGKNWKGRPRQIERYKVQVFCKDEETCTEKTRGKKIYILRIKLIELKDIHLDSDFYFLLKY